MEGNRKVLVISYYFPPSGGPGVQRVLKFVKYLPEFGWEPVVLTVNEDADFPARDESLLADIPEDVKVYRTFIPEPYKIYRKFTGKNPNEPVDIATLSENSNKKITDNISNFIRSNFFVPDARVGWLPFALAKGLKVIKQEKINLVFSSAPPYTCHLIGMGLHEFTNRPWVADFRDSWVGWLSTPKRYGLPAKLEKYYEHRTIKEATKIITVSEGVRQDLEGRCKTGQRDKWTVLPNGFDSEDFRKIKDNYHSRKFTITYTGSLYGKRNPHYFLTAVEEAFKANPAIRADLSLIFVGRVDNHVKKMLTGRQLMDIAEFTGYVSHQESIRFLLKSDILLLIIDDDPKSTGIIPGKLFEYLGSGRPVLALAPPDGEAAKLIRNTCTGVVVSLKEIEKIKNTILSYYNMWKAGKLGKGTVNIDKIKKYERRETTKKLAKIFNELI